MDIGRHWNGQSRRTGLPVPGNLVLFYIDGTLTHSVKGGRIGPHIVTQLNRQARRGYE